MLVDQIMSQNLHTVLPKDNLKTLSEILKKVSYHHLPVVSEKNELLGIISDRDVMRNMSPFLDTEDERECDRELFQRTAEDIMSTDPITISPNTRIKTASILLLEHNFSCLPIIDEENILLGLLTWKDILNFHIYSD